MLFIVIEMYLLNPPMNTRDNPVVVNQPTKPKWNHLFVRILSIFIYFFNYVNDYDKYYVKVEYVLQM